MKYLESSKNNKKVYYEEIDSHAATHILDTPQLIDLLKELIPQIRLEKDYIELEHNFERTIGFTDLVINKPGDKLVYAKRKNRDAFNPFNKSQKAQPCSYMSLALKKRENGYELLSAYIGREGTPPFPNEPQASPESVKFWNTHSFAFGTQEIQEWTLTNQCPW